ncbi:MAG: TetR/AcrR family transcriptional regulator [Anaerolineae bacterium]|nr:TetR/AcrR family transcriptional regulator [Anaerolineae bacterium]
MTPARNGIILKVNMFISKGHSMVTEKSSLTDKAQHTRQHILDTALSLFVSNGYEATTMREIASAADCSVGLTYRYFARKEELVLELYWQMAAQTDTQISQLPAGSLADRFHQLMITRLAQSADYRESFRALFAATLNPNSGVSIFGEDTLDMHQQVREGFRSLVLGASEPPPAAQAEDLATLLYGIHFAVLLFWLYDRSPHQRATAELLALFRDVLAFVRNMLVLPIVRKQLARAARIANGLFVTASH